MTPLASSNLATTNPGPASFGRPYLGHGVGLRVPHYDLALSTGLDVDWVECITENYLGGGGRPRAVLERLRKDMPLVFHGVSMGIGSVQGPSDHYLSQIKELFQLFEPAWVSDHLCWTHHAGNHSHDLLPLPYTDEALQIVTTNVHRVQDCLGRPLVMENVSSYLTYRNSTMSEWDFLAELVHGTGCKLLLDLNNVIVSAENHGFSPTQFVEALPQDAVWQFHLANHTNYGHYRLDSHKGAVPNEVWQLYEAVLPRFGRVSTLVEWDEDIPEWEVLRADQRHAARIEAAWLQQSSLGARGEATT